MKYPTSFRGWKTLMETPPGMEHAKEPLPKGTAGQALGFNHETGKMEWLSPAQVSMQKAIQLREEAKEKLRWAKPGLCTNIAALELLAAEERVRAEIAEAKHEE